MYWADNVENIDEGISACKGSWGPEFEKKLKPYVHAAWTRSCRITAPVDLLTMFSESLLVACMFIHMCRKYNI